MEWSRLEQGKEPGSNILCAPGDWQKVTDERAVRRRSSDPESCADTREGFGEALTGAPVGWVLGREKLKLQGADRCRKKRKATRRAPS